MTSNIIWGLRQEQMDRPRQARPSTLPPGPTPYTRLLALEPRPLTLDPGFLRLEGAYRGLHPGEQMARKLQLAGAIILIPTKDGQQIAFAVLICSFCLYVSLRLNPYVDDKLEKLHIMSLSAQCITLFYALL